MTPRWLLSAVLCIVTTCLMPLTPASGDSGGQTLDLSSLSDNELKTVVIRLERTSCYGNCPAYSVTIHGDGRIEYAGG